MSVDNAFPSATANGGSPLVRSNSLTQHASPNSSSESLSSFGANHNTDGIVSRLVNLVSSPVRNSAQGVSPKLSPFKPDDSEISYGRSITLNSGNGTPSALSSSSVNGASCSIGSFNVVSNGTTSGALSSSVIAGEQSSSSLSTTYYSPTASVESVDGRTQGVHRTSVEEVTQLNSVLAMTDISCSPARKSPSLNPERVSLEAAVKLELLQDEVHSLQEALAVAKRDNHALQSVVSEYEQTMSSIIGISVRFGRSFHDCL